MNFRKLLICFISLIILSAVMYLFACGWYIVPDMGYASYFRNDIPGKNNYYYSYLNFYTENSDKNKLSDKEENIREWKKHLGGQVSEEDIEQLLYGIPLSELNGIYRKAIKRQWNKIDGIWTVNSMMQRMIRLRDMNTLNYLMYAKACEQQSGRRTESWDYTVPANTRVQDSLLQRGIELYRMSRPEFTRLRYAFQLVRLAYYSNRNEDCITYYREMVEPVKSGAMAAWWAMSFYAGALDLPEESAYYFSKVFDHCPRYSQQAMTSFRWLAGSIDTAWVASLCENDYEKAVVHAMVGFTCFHPALEPLKHVHNLCPAIPYIETLLIREINKVEDGLGSTHFHINDSLDSSETLLHARELKDLAIRFAGLREVQHPALWYTAAAYLAYLTGEYEQALLLADVAENEQPEDKVRDQLLMVRLLVETGTAMINDTIEARILPSLQWLFHKQQTTGRSDKSFVFFDRALAHYLAEKLPAIYLAAGQPVKAALCAGIAEKYSTFANENIETLPAFAILDRQASVEQLDGMLQNLSGTGEEQSAYEAFLYGHSHFDENDILELQGTKYMRRLQFRDAATCFAYQSSASALFHLEYDPFAEPLVTGAINRQPPEDILPPSKLTFTVEMAGLQERIQASEKPLPEDLYRYANGLYQMSRFGNSWQLLSYRWTHSDSWARPWITLQPGDEMYHYYCLDCAMHHYMEAGNHSRNREQQARSLFMASHCRQMNMPDASGVYVFKNGKYAAGTYFHDNPCFEALFKKYRKTDFYKDAVARCSYLSDFERMRKR